MTRVKGGTVAKNRRRKVLKQAKGYFGSKHRLFRTAQEQVMHSGAYAYRDRKQRKRDFRKLWITRINAACKANDISYSKFINGLKIASIDINRKMLSEIAINDPSAFSILVKQAKDALEKGPKTTKTEDVKEEKVTKTKEVKEEKVTKTKEVKEEVKKETVKEEKKTEDVDLSSKTLVELKEIAKAKGLKGYSTLKKADLIKLIG